MSQSKARKKLWDGINGAKGASVLTAGGTLGTANIAFTAAPTEGDTITVTDANGTATVFTFWETANVPGVDATVEIDIGANLAAALADAESVIESNAAVGPGIGGTGGIIANVDVTDTDSDLTFRFYPHISNVTVVSSTDGANTTDTAFSAGSAVYINTAKSQCLLEWADASSTLTYLTLPNGTVDGQMIEIYSVSEAESGDTIGVLGDFGTTNNLGTSVGAAGDGAVLYWDQANSQWKVKSSTNFTLSATTAAAI